MGDMDEDLPEEDIVRRKVEAINAMVVAFAFVCEPLQRRQPEPRAKPFPTPSSEIVLPNPPGQPIAPTSMAAQSIPGSPTPVAQSIPGSPPPPYSEFNSGAGPYPTIPTRDAAVPPGRRRSRKKPDPCIFCGKTYTRTGALWDHLEDHPELAGDGPVACPPRGMRGDGVAEPGTF